MFPLYIYISNDGGDGGGGGGDNGDIYIVIYMVIYILVIHYRGHTTHNHSTWI